MASKQTKIRGRARFILEVLNKRVRILHPVNEAPSRNVPPCQVFFIVAALNSPKGVGQGYGMSSLWEFGEQMIETSTRNHRFLPPCTHVCLLPCLIAFLPSAPLSRKFFCGK